MIPQLKIEDAYREAVTALGEAQVRERLLVKHIDDMQRDIDRLNPGKTEPQSKSQDKGAPKPN
jgi:hypothetical protein